MVVRFGNKDLAKYPFLKEAFSYITKYDFKLEDLDSEDYLHLIDKANEKIEQYLFFGRYEYQINYSKTHETIGTRRGYHIPYLIIISQIYFNRSSD